MTKPEIIEALKESHQKFTDYIISLDDRALLFSSNEKWTAGQQLDHIYRSLSPLNKALNLPAWMLRLMFGRANRPSRAYEGLVERYHQKLSGGGRASGRFLPESIVPGSKNTWKEKIDREVIQIIRSLDKFSENRMDQLILPHPLLGKLTLREMMYFTIYHAQHHLDNTIRNLREMNQLA